MSLPKVVIIGGGFSGLAAARKLNHALQSARCTVTLIDANVETCMIPALPDYAAGLIPRDHITASIEKQLPAKATFMQAQVTGISCEAKSIHTNAGDVPFDYVILAMGSSPSVPPDVLQKIHTHTITSIADATALKDAFDEYLRSTQSPSVVINGAGYTGIELAICMARRAAKESKPIQIHLIELRNEILPFLPPPQQQRVYNSIERHGIKLHTQCHIESLKNKHVQLSDGATIDKPLICRTEGTMAPVKADEPTIACLRDGRFKVAPTLALDTFPYIFAAGDAAAFHVPNGYLRKAVNFAFYAGKHAGMNVMRAIKQQPLRPFKPIDLGWVIPLGDDSVGKAFGSVPLSGKMGLRMHYVMCGYRNYNMQNFWRLCGHAFRAGAKPTQTRKEHT